MKISKFVLKVEYLVKILTEKILGELEELLKLERPIPIAKRQLEAYPQVIDRIKVLRGDYDLTSQRLLGIIRQKTATEVGKEIDRKASIRETLHETVSSAFYLADNVVKVLIEDFKGSVSSDVRQLAEELSDFLKQEAVNTSYHSPLVRMLEVFEDN
jgi:hypothetical protein